MYLDHTKDNVQEQITNTNYSRFLENGRIEIANYDRYACPSRRYYYIIDLYNLSKEFYINHGYCVTGTFENITFNSGTFFDGSTFNKSIFKNCHFDNTHIRWCDFTNCQFINCSGTIRYIRGTTFKKNCIFLDTHIEIKQIDEYIYLNSIRYNNKYSNLVIR